MIRLRLINGMKLTSESTLIYIPRAGCRSGYDDSTVGVTHKHDWTVHRTEEALGDGNVIIKRGEWQLRGHNIKTLLLEKRYDSAPRRAIRPRAVQEYDVCFWLHHSSLNCSLFATDRPKQFQPAIASEGFPERSYSCFRS